jgi:hypothetical protein
MATLLRQVLEAFETTDTNIRLDALSRQLGVDSGTLDNMIQYWVRKGRIREISNDACHACSTSACPVMENAPRRYTLVKGHEACCGAVVAADSQHAKC